MSPALDPRGQQPDVGAATVGIIVNPHAGKDIRRLVSAAAQTSDATKISILRRVAAGAIEQGARRVLMSSDSHHLAERAVDGLGGPIGLVGSPGTGSHLDTVAAARSMWKADAGAVVALGGDGTCRDVATGWPDVPLIAISTGTNNVFPSPVDATAAGVAAALVASGAVDPAVVTSVAKRVSLRIDDPQRDAVEHDGALVDAALIDAAFVGARAVSDPTKIRWVVACIASPSSTGLASVAGRVHPVGRNEDGGVLIRTGAGGRRVRVPLTPGTFSTLEVASVEWLDEGRTVELPGGGVMAYDGERTSPVSPDTSITTSVERSGPRMIDVERTLRLAADDRRFDADERPDGDVAAGDSAIGPEVDSERKDIHGD